MRLNPILGSKIGSEYLGVRHEYTDLLSSSCHLERLNQKLGTTPGGRLEACNSSYQRQSAIGDASMGIIT